MLLTHSESRNPKAYGDCKLSLKKDVLTSMEQESVEKLSGLVPEVWFDLIARVIPGAIILFVSTQSTAISNVTIGGLAIGIVVVYLIGMVFDLCSSICFEWVFAACAKLAPGLFVPGAKIWKAIDTLPRAAHGLLVKMMAEGIMFRSLFTFGLIQMSQYEFAINITTFEQYMQPLQIRVLPLQCSATLTVLSLCCWLKMGETASSRLRNLQQAESTQ